MSGVLCAADGDLAHYLVEDLETPMGVYPLARIEWTDVSAIVFPK